MAARRRAGSFSPKTSRRLRSIKVDMLLDMACLLRRPQCDFLLRAHWIFDVSLRLCVRINQRARGKTRRPDDRLRPGILEFRQIGCLDILILNLKDASFGPAAALPELDVADDRLERSIARELCELCVIKRGGAGDRLLDDLHLGVSLRSDVITQRIGPRVLSERLIFRHHFRDAGEHHLLHRQPILVIDEPVEKRTELRFDRTVLRTDLAPPTILGSRPTSLMARSRATESFKYEQRNRMSGLTGFRLRMNGTRSVPDSGYRSSETSLNPCLSACVFAPSTGFFEKGASAARIAIVSGFGV